MPACAVMNAELIFSSSLMWPLLFSSSSDKYWMVLDVFLRLFELLLFLYLWDFLFMSSLCECVFLDKIMGAGLPTYIHLSKRVHIVHISKSCTCISSVPRTVSSVVLGTVYRKFWHQIKHFCCGSAFLLHNNGIPETANVWNQDPEWNLLKLQPFLWLHKLASGVSVNVMTTLMLVLTLAQVNAFCSSHYQTLIKHSAVHRKQVEHDDCLLRWI